MYNEILLDHQKEHICISSNEVDEPRASYTEWSKSERERQTSYINANMESRKMVLMNLLPRQQRRCRRREWTWGHRGGRRGWYKLGEQHWNLYITTRKIDNQWEFVVWHSELKLGAPTEVWAVVGSEREVQGRGHVCTCGWFMFMSGRNWHNTVKQFFSN